MSRCHAIGAVRRGARRLRWDVYRVSVRGRLALWHALAVMGRPRIQMMEESARGPIIGDDDPVRALAPFHSGAATKPAYRYSARVDGRAWVEPRYGYVITAPAALIYFSGVPPLIGYARMRAMRRGIRREDAVLTLRHPFDTNYFHALFDVLPRVAMADAAGMPHNTPILISRRLAETPFFGAWMTRGDLARRRWLVQDDSYVEAATVWYARSDMADRALLDRALDLIDAPHADPLATDRIFLGRSLARGRSLSNMAAIAPILDRYGVRVVDADDLPADEQMRLFAGVRVVVGLHGAGLSNLLFRRGAPLDLVELCPPIGATLDFCGLARVYGYGYYRIVGADASDATRAANYSIDPAALDATLQTILSTLPAATG